MKNSTLSTIGFSLAVGLTACTSVPKPPAQSCEVPKTSASTSSKPIELPLPNTAFAHPTKPTSNAEFLANVLSCEATVNANTGYLQSIEKRLAGSSISVSDLPCNIILDIRDNLQRTVEHCSVVVEPSGIYMEMDPTQKLARKKLAEQATEITTASRQAIELMYKQEKRCFGGNTTVFNHSILL